MLMVNVCGTNLRAPSPSRAWESIGINLTA